MAEIPGDDEDIEQLPDGVYLHLSERDYFGQRGRLGSSDDIRLALRKQGWWWTSKYNKRAQLTASTAQDYGSALHAIILEGVHAYESRFVVEPDRMAFKGLIVSATDAERALREGGYDLTGSSKWKAADWYRTARVNMPERPIWPDIMAKFEKRLERPDGTKLRSVSAEENEQIRIMYEAALEDPEIREFMGVGSAFPPLAEVSILWTDRWGIRRRSRLDKLTPNYTGDLKSLGNWKGRPLNFSIDDHIRGNGYDTQVGSYQQARKWMHKAIAERAAGVIHGGTAEEVNHLLAIVETDISWEWLWFFYQKPSATAGLAPIVFPLWEDWEGPYHLEGHRKWANAAKLYLDSVQRFGLGDQPAADGRPARPWTHVEPVHFTNREYAEPLHKPFIYPRPGNEQAVEFEREDLDR